MPRFWFFFASDISVNIEAGLKPIFAENYLFQFMKIKYTMGIVMLLFGIGFVYSDKNGPSVDATGAPLANGNPGNTCAVSGCHTGSADNGCKVAIDVTNKGGSTSVNQFTAGGVYTVKITVANTFSNGTMGFEATILDPNRAKSGTMSNTSAGSKLRTIGSRQFCEHSAPSTSGTWSIDWTAPATAPDSVVIYAAGNATNNDGAKTGDDIKTTRFTLKKSTTSALGTITNSGIRIFPNPTAHLLQVSLDMERLVLYNLQGQQLLEATNTRTLDVTSLEAGFYLLQVEKDGKIETCKIQKS